MFHVKHLYYMRQLTPPTRVSRETYKARQTAIQ